MSLILLAAAMTMPAVSKPTPACPITVQFGSFAMGIDQPAAQRIERLLNSDRGVAGISRQRWGREGEYTLCVKLKPRVRPEPLAARIRALIPAKPYGPISVRVSRLRTPPGSGPA